MARARPSDGARAVIEVDTEALSLHLRCTPSYVRLLASKGVIAPLPQRRRLHRLGRPSLMFDLDAVDAALATALGDGRVSLDAGRVRLRK